MWVSIVFSLRNKAGGDLAVRRPVDREAGDAELSVGQRREAGRRGPRAARGRERPTAFTLATRGKKVGALVVTDQRLIWTAKKGEPVVIERDDIRRTERATRFTITKLEVELSDGRIERFDNIEPGDRAELIIAALASPAS